MVEKKIAQLTPKEILEKEFKTSLKGYNQDEVDKFLDTVIKDYELFQKRIDVLENENAKLKLDADKLAQQQTRQVPPAGNTNYDILKRLSNLEKHVFGNKLFD
ncbi:cell division regulator GpsB [Anaerobacillus isosaccharinicus]|uniref:Cell division protein DivIVA n=1 Tax=Anaerobacillus isosaccharinicus TaxID=1532552 RepID=A0A1S2L6Y1_9BACI|nr:cell division regulator GpsB [Anaerobacillus isosaccharinicus]MBA5586927.1 cell division regulator GpsB [Anaerobacillus isosaccharinicus]QOY34866.1 cell division regulator GpsB [Anaerobacillus isosaccharinicus]